MHILKKKEFIRIYKLLHLTNKNKLMQIQINPIDNVTG